MDIDNRATVPPDVMTIYHVLRRAKDLDNDVCCLCAFPLAITSTPLLEEAIPAATPDRHAAARFFSAEAPDRFVCCNCAVVLHDLLAS